MEVNSPFKQKSNNPLQQLEDALVDISKKLPQFPLGLKEFIVKFGPYLVALGVIFGALSLLSFFGVGGLSVANRFIFGAKKINIVQTG